MGVLVTKKGKKKESSAPVLDILEATIKILSAEYLAAGDVVTKIGGLSEARYGVGFWDDDMVLKAEDLPGFTFVARLKPKTEFGGSKVTGTRVDHDTIRALPGQDSGSRVEANPELGIPAPDFD